MPERRTACSGLLAAGKMLGSPVRPSTFTFYLFNFNLLKSGRIGHRLRVTKKARPAVAGLAYRRLVRSLGVVLRGYLMKRISVGSAETSDAGSAVASVWGSISSAWRCSLVSRWGAWS
jgi:hypothetical protein